MHKIAIILNKIQQRAKLLALLYLRCIIYSLLYIRIICLKIHHLFFIRPQKLYNIVVRTKKLLSKTNVRKSFFAWEVSGNSVTRRIKLVIIGFTILFVVLILRVLIVSSASLITSDKGVYTSSLGRLNIVDRNNYLLAGNLPAASLYANPFKVVDPEIAIQKISSVFPDLDSTKVLGDLKSSKKFVWIKRDITPLEHQKIYNLGVPGFDFEKEQKRIYPYGKLVSHIVGYVSRDMKGLAGVESFFDKFLLGQQEIEDRRKLGNTLQLSIDVRIQHILSEEIDYVMKKFSAKGAAGIIADPNTGEILALVSKPDFDPHNPGSADSVSLFNMATQGVYEMGSGMKGLTMAIGMDTKSTTLYDAYDLSYMKVGGFQVKDYYKLTGWHSVPHIFLKSSNIGVSQIMLEIGKENLLKYLRKLKLLEQLKIELLERSRPLFPNYSRWNDLSLTTMAYGYGISVSPAHFMQAMIPVVNGGILYPLTLIKRDPNNPLKGQRIFKESTSINMRKLMRLVVSEGTGRKAEVAGYYIGGKTGTANIAYQGKYDKNRRVSSFFGIMPASNPKYMIYIIYNEPVGIKESLGFAGGGWTAAPTAGAVFKKLAALHGLPKLDANSNEIRSLNDIQYKIKDET